MGNTPYHQSSANKGRAGNRKKSGPPQRVYTVVLHETCPGMIRLPHDLFHFKNIILRHDTRYWFHLLNRMTVYRAPSGMRRQTHAMELHQSLSLQRLRADLPRL